ncbi:hypothetical protein MRX96_020553 [Rhipicephalus microplus]
MHKFRHYDGIAYVSASLSRELVSIEKTVLMNYGTDRSEVICRTYVRKTLISEKVAYNLEDAKQVLDCAESLHPCRGAGRAKDFTYDVLTKKLEQQISHSDGLVFSVTCKGAVKQQGSSCISCKYVRKVILTRKSYLKRKERRNSVSTKLRVLSQRNKRMATRLLDIAGRLEEMRANNANVADKILEDKISSLPRKQQASGPGVCESLVRALGPDARSLRPYLQRHMAVPGVAMRKDLFECLLSELPRWPAQQLGADLGRIAQLAERATPADGPAQAQMLRLLWSAPAQGLPEYVTRRFRAAGRALLGRASMPDTVVRRYEALFEDGRSSAEARDVARLLAEHAFDCRHAPPGDSELDRLPVTSARHALAILSHFARSRSCAGSMLVPLPDEVSSGQLVWQAPSLFDHGYPKSLGLQESEAADYSRARTLEKERAYNDMLRFVRESMKNSSLSSLSLELLLKIGIDVASNCQPPGSTVSLLRSIIIELQRRREVSPENNRVFSHLLTSFQRQKNCSKLATW